MESLLSGRAVVGESISTMGLTVLDGEQRMEGARLEESCTRYEIRKMHSRSGSHLGYPGYTASRPGAT